MRGDTQWTEDDGVVNLKAAWTKEEKAGLRLAPWQGSPQGDEGARGGSRE